MKNEIESKDSKILSLTRELFIRNNNEDDEKENKMKSSKKRMSYDSNIINSVLNSDLALKSIFKTNTKRKFGELNSSQKGNPNGSNSNNVNGSNYNDLKSGNDELNFSHKRKKLNGGAEMEDNFNF